MSESEDRTQAPSKRRLQLAREHGQVAHSPELTAAAGLLAAVGLLGVWGDDLAGALVGLVREPWTLAPALAADPAEVAARVRGAALAVAGPLLGIAGGAAGAAAAVHLLQTGVLWMPNALAPDPGRLVAGIAAGEGLAGRAARGGWVLAKALAVAAVAALAIRSRLPGLAGLATLEPPALAVELAGAVRAVAAALAVAALALGAVDYALRRARLEARLRMTPEEVREEQRSVDGDPAIRSRQRAAARARRDDPREALAGASLVLTAPSGLTVVLGGGPPPGRVLVRAFARGASGLRLRDEAGRQGVPLRPAPELALRLARREAGPVVSAALAACWPRSGRTTAPHPIRDGQGGAPAVSSPHTSDAAESLKFRRPAAEDPAGHGRPG